MLHLTSKLHFKRQIVKQIMKKITKKRSSYLSCFYTCILINSYAVQPSHTEISGEDNSFLRIMNFSPDHFYIFTIIIVMAPEVLREKSDQELTSTEIIGQFIYI